MADNNGEQHSGRFAIIPSVALDDPRMTLTLLKLLCVIGSYGNKDGYCRVKLATLASRMSHDGKPVGKSAISNGLKKLRELGYLEVMPRFAKDTGQLANSYRILFDAPEKMPQKVNPGSSLEVNPHSSPEVNPGTPLEVNPLNDLSERSDRTILPTAAAISNPVRTMNGATPLAAAAVVDRDLDQTAEAVRQHLRMGRDKLAGLKLILRLYPNRRPWLENEANLCFSTLRVRPLELKHFSNWLQSSEIRRKAQEAKEEAEHETRTTGTPEPSGSGQRRPHPETERTLTGEAGAAAIWNAVLARLQAPDGGGAGTLHSVSRDDE